MKIEYRNEIAYLLQRFTLTFTPPSKNRIFSAPTPKHYTSKGTLTSTLPTVFHTNILHLTYIVLHLLRFINKTLDTIQCKTAAQYSSIHTNARILTKEKISRINTNTYGKISGV